MLVEKRLSPSSFLEPLPLGGGVVAEGAETQVPVASVTPALSLRAGQHCPFPRQCRASRSRAG